MADKQSRELITDYTAKLYGKGERILPKKDADKLSGLTVNVDVDVAEALTGLKALQREARKATQALAELEAQVYRVGGIPADMFKGGAGE